MCMCKCVFRAYKFACVIVVRRGDLGIMIFRRGYGEGYLGNIKLLRGRRVFPEYKAFYV